MTEHIFDDDFSEFMLEQALNMKIDRDIEKYEKLPDVPISQSLENRIEKLINKEKKKETNRKILIIFKQIGVTVTACFVILSLTMLTVPNVRAEIKNTIIEWFDKFTRFTSDETENVVVDVSKYAITKIPSGFYVVEESVDSIMNMVIYMNNDNKILSFSCLPSSGSMDVDSEDKEYKIIEEIYHVFESVDGSKENSIIWQKDDVTFSVDGNLSIEELLEIAKSVK